MGGKGLAREKLGRRGIWVVFETARPSREQSRKGGGRSPGGEAKAGRGVLGEREAGRASACPPHRGASRGLGGRGTNPGLQVQGTDTRADQCPQDLLKMGNKRAGTGHQRKPLTREQDAGCSLSPRHTVSVFRMPGINLHPGDTKMPGSCHPPPGACAIMRQPL